MPCHAASCQIMSVQFMPCHAASVHGQQLPQSHHAYVINRIDVSSSSDQSADQNVRLHGVVQSTLIVLLILVRYVGAVRKQQPHQGVILSLACLQEGGSALETEVGVGSCLHKTLGRRQIMATDGLRQEGAVGLNAQAGCEHGRGIENN